MSSLDNDEKMRILNSGSADSDPLVEVILSAVARATGGRVVNVKRVPDGVYAKILHGGVALPEDAIVAAFRRPVLEQGYKQREGWPGPAAVFVPRVPNLPDDGYTPEVCADMPHVCVTVTSLPGLCQLTVARYL